MPERVGDLSIEERVNSGQCELSNFMPANTDDDMVIGTNKSAMRTWIWYDRELRRTHQSTSRQSQYFPSIELPDYVISQIIRIRDRTWSYKTGTSPTDIRRVFIERDQAIELDIEKTLSYLSASEGTPRYETVNGQLQEEAGDIDNQVIMQLMYERVRNGESLLPLCSKKLMAV